MSHPEADMLDAGILGQPTAQRTLAQALSQGRVAQAYLFDGPSGVGKQRAALALACAALEERDGTPDLQARILAGKHPDVRVYAPRSEGHRNIPVEYLREEILPFAQFAPFEARRAFLIFPEADVSFPQYHAEAANALLKTLEEPRPRVHFVLLAERPDRLLPTIRSRCQRVRFRRLPPEALDAILADHGVDAAERGPAAALADGRADRALALAEAGRARALLEEAITLDEAIARGAPGPLLERSEALAKDESLSLVLDALAMLYRDMAALRAGLPDETLLFRHAAPRIRERATSVDAGEAAARVRLIHHVVGSFERNANLALALDALLLQLGQARQVMPELDAAPRRP